MCFHDECDFLHLKSTPAFNNPLIKRKVEYNDEALKNTLLNCDRALKKILKT